MKYIPIYFLCVILCMITPITVFAEDSGNKDSSAFSVNVLVPQQNKPLKETAESIQKADISYLYPVSVYETHEDGRREIIKTYELSEDENPEQISKEPIERDGWKFELTDITKNETSSFDSREHTETVTINTKTNDFETILKQLAPTVEYESEDGYTGILSLDISSIQIKTAGTKKDSYNVSANREYLNLSSNDTSLIPKTINENGNTLTLSNVAWKTQADEAIDYDQLPESYTAIATYTTTATKTTITGYITTAKYCGNISKAVTGKTLYTAYFFGTPIVKPVETNISEQDEIEKENITDTDIKTEAEVTPEQKQLGLPAIISILAAVGLISGGFIYFYIQKKKKGGEENDEEAI